MQAESWELLAIISFSIAGLLFLATVIIFIVLKIPRVIGDLNNRIANKEIEEIKKSFTNTGRLNYQEENRVSISTKEREKLDKKTYDNTVLRNEFQNKEKKVNNNVIYNSNGVRNLGRYDSEDTEVLEEIENLYQNENELIDFEVKRSIKIVHTNEVL